jgi:hypothetical protein
MYTDKAITAFLLAGVAYQGRLISSRNEC